VLVPQLLQPAVRHSALVDPRFVVAGVIVVVYLHVVGRGAIQIAVLFVYISSSLI
jgi:hypothetical protein